jgi:predicted permease
VPAALMVGALVTLGIGIASVFWLRRIRHTDRAARPVADRVAAAASGESPLTVARRR